MENYSLSSTINAFISSKKNNLINSTWYVGWSGGADSTALLLLLRDLSAVYGAHIVAIHVHHGMHASADAWLSHCVKFSEHFSIPLIVEKVDVSVFSDGYEGAARAARWSVFSKVCGDNGVLFLAHHANDQVETFLQRFIRGGGVFSLASIYAENTVNKVRVYRPLLPISKFELIAYLRKHNIRWIEDSSNNDIKMERNFMRHKLVPLFVSKWQSFVKQANRCVSCLQEDAEHLSAYANAERLSISSLCMGVNGIDCASFSKLSSEKRSLLLRVWIRSRGWYVPDVARMNEFLRQVECASDDRHPSLTTTQYNLVASNRRVFLLDINALDHIKQYFRDWRFGLVSPFCKLELVASDVNQLYGCVIVTVDELVGLGLITSNALKKLLSMYKIPYPLRKCIPCVCKDNKIMSIGEHILVEQALISVVFSHNL